MIPDNHVLVSQSRWYVITHLRLRYSTTFWKVVQLLRYTAISSIPVELLVEIFDWCRLHDEYLWNHRCRWFNLLQVCRRWRDVIPEWASRLNLRCRYNCANHITTMPSYLTQLPLIIHYSGGTYWERPVIKENLLLALQHRDRLCDIFISCSGFQDSELQMALANAFPMLETLSLQDNTSQALPHHLVAPHLRALHLRQITIPRECLSLANATKLSSLRIEGIENGGIDFPPGDLVDCIANLPQLEELFIIILPDAHLHYLSTELPPTPITRVILARLSRLISRGTGAYLGNLLTRIGAHFLRDSHFITSPPMALASRFSRGPSFLCRHFSVQSRPSNFGPLWCRSTSNLSPSPITLISLQLPCRISNLPSDISRTMVSAQYVTWRRSAVQLRPPFP